MKLELNPRPGAVNCSYCLSEVAAEEGWTCNKCGVRLHEECTLDLPSCPTVGCTTSPRPPAREETSAEAATRRSDLARARARREAEREEAQAALRSRIESSERRRERDEKPPAFFDSALGRGLRLLLWVGLYWVVMALFGDK